MEVAPDVSGELHRLLLTSGSVPSKINLKSAVCLTAEVLSLLLWLAGGADDVK